MAAPQIPHLSTLGRGQGRSRGRGQGGSSSLSDEESKAAKDKIVQQTDQDATISRLSAVDLGYLDDPFAKLFASGSSQRRFPIINRGTYVRTIAIDNLVHHFLASSPSHKQIVSLGAGSDTRYFRLRSQSPSLPPFTYHETDFPTNTSAKISIINYSSTLSALISHPVATSSVTTSSELTSLSSPTYHIHPLDLRNLSQNPPSAIPELDPAVPTLLLSECCLTYLPPHLADATITYFTDHLFPPSTPLGLILYEPIRPNDAFGKVMVKNLAQRGIVLQTLQKYGSKETQVERLRAYGFSGGREVKTVDGIWEGIYPPWEREKERVGKLEMVDEVEEWRLLAGHYCVAWGWREGEGEEGKGVWEGWKDEHAPVKAHDHE